MMTDTATLNGASSQDVQPVTFLSAFQQGRTILQAAGVANAGNETFWLLEAGLGVSRLDVYADPQGRVEPEEWARTATLFHRRASQEPLQYLVGTQAFRGRDFLVNPDVLIPRPETELVMEEVLASRFSVERCQMVDMGTGSGCLAVSLALDCPGAMIAATDCSAPALHVARDNARRHGVARRIRFFHGDCLEPLSGHAFAGKISVIVSNPPYIPADQCARLPREVRAFEPLLALNGGRNGLEMYDRLLADSPALLHPGGILVMEMGAGQSEDICRKVSKKNEFVVNAIRRDQAGIDRVICLERKA